MGLAVANANNSPNKEKQQMRMTNDAKAQEKHQQNKIHNASSFLNTDRLGLAHTQGSNWFYRAIESGLKEDS